MAGGEIEPPHSITKPTKVRVEAREERKCGMRLDTLLSSCVQASYQASPSTQAALPINDCGVEGAVAPFPCNYMGDSVDMLICRSWSHEGGREKGGRGL
jgi:hypothetical protein